MCDASASVRALGGSTPEVIAADLACHGLCALMLIACCTEQHRRFSVVNGGSGGDGDSGVSCQNVEQRTDVHCDENVEQRLACTVIVS